MRTILVAVAFLVGLTSCGNSREEDRAAAAKAAAASASASASASAKAQDEALKAEEQAEAEAQARRVARQKAAWSKCKRQTSELKGALTQIDSRLNIGMNVGALGERLGDAQVAYDSIDFKQLGVKCTFNVGVPLEAAFNQYITSKNEWQTCIDDYACQVEGTVLAKLQTHWSKAGKSMIRVRNVLASPAALARTSATLT